MQWWQKGVALLIFALFLQLSISVQSLVPHRREHGLTFLIDSLILPKLIFSLILGINLSHQLRYLLLLCSSLIKLSWVKSPHPHFLSFLLHFEVQLLQSSIISINVLLYRHLLVFVSWFSWRGPRHFGNTLVVWSTFQDFIFVIEIICKSLLHIWLSGHVLLYHVSGAILIVSLRRRVLWRQRSQRFLWNSCSIGWIILSGVVEALVPELHLVANRRDIVNCVMILGYPSMSVGRRWVGICHIQLGARKALNRRLLLRCNPFPILLSLDHAFRIFKAHVQPIQIRQCGQQSLLTLLWPRPKGEISDCFHYILGATIFACDIKDRISFWLEMSGHIVLY